ncbi:uncharacterized protein LOC143057292 [Mytilus galloprovincialis]|uniref:uncharacterized protein LOC143057292 n=1 Tax=Mytilus galloprovincialis TaxID=29158 RepID=UPI003F7B4065
MASARTGAALELRKIRKKIRQIENLESLDRDLTDEELNKILRKNRLRENLLELLAEHGEEESFTSSTRSELTDDGILTESSSYHDYIVDNGYNDSIITGEVTIIEPEDETNTDLIEIDVTDDPEEEMVINKTTNAVTGEILEDNMENTKPVTKETWETKTKSPKKSQPVTKATSKEIRENTNPSPVKKTKQMKSISGTQTTEKTEKFSKLKATLHKWRFGKFEVIELEGHSDLVTDADNDGDLLVTSSRDTTVKLWCLETLSELRNYGGHNSAVTCVQLLSKEDSASVCKSLGTESTERLFISGSYDCSFKIWSTGKSGEALRSVYTFNPVTKVIYHPVAQAIITGSDGGKLEIWDIASGEKIHSVHPYQESITGLKVVNGTIFSCSAEGVISVHKLQDDQIICLFVSENIRSENNGHLTQRYIRGFDVRDGLIYYGDDGTNIKVLDWRKGLVHKLINHCEDFGITDSISCHGNIIVSSAYSLDNGAGYVNVRYLPEETYMTTLDDEDTGRILSLSYAESGNKDIVITAGTQLKVWISNTEQRRDIDEENLVSTRYVPKLAQRHYQDSDVESDVETSDSEAEEDGRHDHPSQSRDSSQGWLSYCNII